jgi:hypothetical protein
LPIDTPSAKNGTSAVDRLRRLPNNRQRLRVDPIDFAGRIATAKYENDTGRAIFDSLNCPGDIDSSRTTSDTARLLKRLRHFQFDFESNPSKDENDCVANCAALLRDGGQAQALSLWKHLTQIARSLATSGGDINRPQLADRLRSVFSLNEFPNFVQDWRKLSDHFNIRMEQIRGTLGGKIELPRNDANTSRREHRLTALVGSSGSGKTVLAKRIAGDAAKDRHVIWLTSTDLNLDNLSERFSALGLQHTFPELVAEANGQPAF